MNFYLIQWSLQLQKDWIHKKFFKTVCTMASIINSVASYGERQRNLNKLLKDCLNRIEEMLNKNLKMEKNLNSEMFYGAEVKNINFLFLFCPFYKKVSGYILDSVLCFSDEQKKFSVICPLVLFFVNFLPVPWWN